MEKFDPVHLVRAELPCESHADDTRVLIGVKGSVQSFEHCDTRLSMAMASALTRLDEHLKHEF